MNNLPQDSQKTGSIQINGNTFATYSDDVFDAVKTKKDIVARQGKIKASVAVVPHGAIKAKGNKWQPRANGAGQYSPSQLIDDIKKNGLLTPLVVDEKLNLLSGYHRHSAIIDIFNKRKKVKGQVCEVPVIIVEFPDNDKKRSYARISNQHAHRNGITNLDAASQLLKEVETQKTYLDTLDEESKISWAKKWLKDECGLTKASCENVAKKVLVDEYKARGLSVVPTHQRLSIEQKAWNYSAKSNRSRRVLKPNGQAYIYARSNEVSHKIGSVLSQVLPLTKNADINVSSQVLLQGNVKMPQQVIDTRENIKETLTTFNKSLLIPAGKGIVRSVLLFGQIKGNDAHNHVLWTWNNQAQEFEYNKTICD